MPTNVIENEIENVSVISAALSDGFQCGPLAGSVAELVALGAIPCPGCGLFIHAERRKVA